MPKKKPVRSGTMWSTAEYAAGGYDPTLSIRLRQGFKRRLSAIAERRGVSISMLIEDWVADEDGGKRTDRDTRK